MEGDLNLNHQLHADNELSAQNNRNDLDLTTTTRESSSTMSTDNFNPLGTNAALNYQMNMHNFAPTMLRNDLLQHVPVSGVNTTNSWSTSNSNNESSTVRSHSETLNSIQGDASTVNLMHNMFGGTIQQQQQQQLGMYLPTGELNVNMMQNVTAMNIQPNSSQQEESNDNHGKCNNPSGIRADSTVEALHNLNEGPSAVGSLQGGFTVDNASHNVEKQQTGSSGNSMTSQVNQPSFVHALFGGTLQQNSDFSVAEKNVDGTKNTTEMQTNKLPPKPMVTAEQGSHSDSMAAIETDPGMAASLQSNTNIVHRNSSQNSLELEDKRPKTINNNDDGDLVVVTGSKRPPSCVFDDMAHPNEEKTQEEEVVVVSVVPSKQAEGSSVKNKDTQMEVDEDVVILSEGSPKSPKSREREEKQRLQRRKRRRQMKRMLIPGSVPSFVQLITPNTEKEDNELEQVVVDVDEYLGLNKISPIPSGVPSNIIKQETMKSSPQISLPKDEGWYEGSINMGLPDESRYLNRLHVLIRKNLEFFSASRQDTETNQAGRKQPIVLGQVGIRCIHCAKAAADAAKSEPIPDGVSSLGSNYSTQGSVAKLWPAGSVSYPINIAGLYPVCSQKPALHFENCPNMPLDIKGQFYRLTHDDEGAAKRRKLDGESKTMSVLLYYAIACARVGLVDTKSGMRFSRDLKLDPLSVESVRSEVEETTGKRVSPIPQASKQVAQAITQRLAADKESEKVLTAAAAEIYDPKVDLATSDDRNYVSDFIFLSIKQMAVCHALPSDFSSRGKKTKLMRIGFAGFCCKHCSQIQSAGYTGHADYSCRSFASAADNLASAIANSFHIHLQKCSLLPPEIKKAIAAYKRLHSRQLNGLPHGSQRKLFHILWKRLRACDKTEAEMEEITSKLEQSANEMKTAQATENVAAGQNVVVKTTPDEIPSQLLNPGSSAVSLPECDDEETKAVLKAAEQDSDPVSNDNLLLPSDRPLITDFIFLIMKQVKVAQPSALDFARGRRSTQLNPTQAGLCCKHCIDKAGYGASIGRSFPSQADNLASSLNTSLYQHIQKCQFAPDSLKRAIVNLRKFHSVQVAALRFGSQRRFFNLLWARLSAVEVDTAALSEGDRSNTLIPTPTMQSPIKNVQVTVDDSTILKFGYIERGGGCFECQYCRMVPMSLRANGSVALSRPTEEYMQKHQSNCKGDSFDLSYAAELFGGMLKSCEACSFELISASTSEVSTLFRDIVRELVGGDDELLSIFTDGIATAAKRQEKVAGSAVIEEKFDTKGFWKKFPDFIDADKLSGLFGKFTKIVGLSPESREHNEFIRYFQTVSPSFVYRLKSESDEVTTPTPSAGSDTLV